ncbi:MAG TPA: PP2C family protein-serine/threonine phosphatase [Candidatus Methylacidiphilales bacterium]|nr:PP2C family protein-serine/threonine phosphatase [Candidatus Methylacidiphilales bacterium]
MLKQYADELKKRERQLATELSLAGEIQHALLPQHYPSFPSRVSEQESAVHFAHRYVPMGHVGGDFFTVLPISDTKAGIFICDVMGHGVHAALITAIQKVLVDELIETAQDPSLFLATLNARLYSVFRKLHTTYFVTAFYTVLDLTSGQMSYASAGHPSPIVIREGSPPRLLSSQTNGPCSPPLGIHDVAQIRTTTDALQSGDRLLLYTDGILEHSDGCLSLYTFLNLIAESVAGASETSVLLDDILKCARQSVQGASFADDICLVEVTVRKLLA